MRDIKYNPLEQLQKRPGMFTGENTLKSIQHFLAGYNFATFRYEIDDSDDVLFVPRQFNDWVAYRLHFYESTSGWCQMIYSRTETENEAIDRFFELLAEFHVRKPHLVAKLIGYQRTYSQTLFRRENDRMVEDKTKVLSYPESISLVTYTDDPGFFAYSDTQEDFPFSGFFPSLEAYEAFTQVKREFLQIVDPDWSAIKLC